MAYKIAKLACLSKIEATYGTDSVPTGAANAMQLNDVTFTPLQSGTEERGIMLPWLGHQGSYLTSPHMQIDFQVEIAGSGAVGTAPAYGDILRACGLSQTISAGVSVVYDPVSSGEEAVSLYFHRDGAKYIMLGCRGTVRMEFAPQRKPRLHFSLKGLIGPVADAALPTADYSGFIEPATASKTNTTLTIHGDVQIGESLSINMGVVVEPRFLIGFEGMQITDRKVTGSAVVEAAPFATKNWFDVATAETKAALQLVHGTVAGNIVQIDAPKVQIGAPSEGSSQGVVNYTLPLELTPDAGDDEFSITVR